MRFAAAPTSLLICDAAVGVAGAVISMEPAAGAPYIDKMLDNIKVLCRGLWTRDTLVRFWSLVTLKPKGPVGSTGLQGAP
jgi:hypothetical protein